MKKIITVLAISIMAIFVMTGCSITTVQEGTVVVQRRWGEIETVLTPGFNIRNWFTTDVQTVDLTVQQVDLSFVAYSIDAQPIRGNITILYYVNIDGVEEMVRRFVDNQQLEQRLQGAFQQEIQNVIASMAAMELVEHRATLGGEITNRLRYLQSDFFITIERVNLEELVFSQAFEQAVEQRMIMEQQALMAVFERERAEELARQRQAVAEIEAQAIIALAEAAAEELRILQDQWDYGSEKALNAILRYRMIAVWDGVLPRVIVAGDTPMDIGFIVDGILGD